MDGDLTANFASRETRGVHVRIAVARTDGAQESGKVMLVETLVVRASRVQSDDVGCGSCASYRTRCSLWTIGFLRVCWIALGATAKECHYLAVDTRLIQRRSVCAELGPESSVGARTLGEYFIGGRQLCGESKRLPVSWTFTWTGVARPSPFGHNPFG